MTDKPTPPTPEQIEELRGYWQALADGRRPNEAGWTWGDREYTLLSRLARAVPALCAEVERLMGEVETNRLFTEGVLAGGDFLRSALAEHQELSIRQGGEISALKIALAEARNAKVDALAARDAELAEAVRVIRGNVSTSTVEPCMKHKHAARSESGQWCGWCDEPVETCITAADRVLPPDGRIGWCPVADARAFLARHPVAEGKP